MTFSAVAPGGYKWFVAGVLCLALTVAVVDRFAMVLVAEPLRASLHLTDTQLGLLQGTGFSLLYCAFAIPLGAVADAANRRNLIIVGLLIWSIATASTALSHSFAQLFIARTFVGMGEACLIPAGMSLLVSTFPPRSLARGVAVFGMGANFGLGFAFLGGGFVLTSLAGHPFVPVAGLGALAAWQIVFLLAAALAIPVLVLLMLVREPSRSEPVRWTDATRGIGYLFANFRVYGPFLIIGAATAVTGYALNAWSSSLFVRDHGMTPAQAGKTIGIVGVLAGPLGTIAGGALLDAMRARRVAGAPLLIMAGGSVVAVIAAAGAGLIASRAGAVASFALFMFESTFTLASLYTGMQMLTPPSLRGVAASFNMMVYTLVGLGIGPTAVGIISDRLGGATGLASAITLVEALMVVVIVPTALLCRDAYQRRVDAVSA